MNKHLELAAEAGDFISGWDDILAVSPYAPETKP